MSPTRLSRFEITLTRARKPASKAAKAAARNAQEIRDARRERIHQLYKKESP